MREEGSVLFNDTLNTFYLQLYGVKHMVKDHSDSKRGRKEGRLTHMVKDHSESERGRKCFI